MFKKIATSLAIVSLAIVSTAQARDAKQVTAWTQSLIRVGHVAHDVYRMNVAFFNVPDSTGDESPITSAYKDNKCNFILRINDRNRFVDVLMEGFYSQEDMADVAYVASLHELGHCLTSKNEMPFKNDAKNELAQDIFALAYIQQNDPDKLDKAGRIFDHIRNDHQETGAHAFGYDYRGAINKIRAMPVGYSPMQISRMIVYNEVTSN